jgi:hypothetical protein
MLRVMPAAVLFLAFSSFFWAGCGNDDKVGPEPTIAVIDLTGIICNPLAPAPGQTTRLTAKVSGTGDNPSYEWQVEAGTLSDNGKITVEWQAPTAPGIYRVWVRGSVGTAVDTMSTYVMVRNITTIDTGLRYTLYPNIIGSIVYCVGASLVMTDDDFRGFHAYNIDAPTSPIDYSSAISVEGGEEFTFFEEYVLAASVTHSASVYRQQPVNVLLYSTSMGNLAISNNELAGQTFRKNQNIHPAASSDLSMIVWQWNKAGSANDGSEDLANIKFRAGMFAIDVLTSAKDSTLYHGIWMYSYYSNIKPMITPDDLAIVYFTDSTGTFEPCLIPLEAEDPKKSERRALMVDENHGIFYYAGITISENTVFQWNPTSKTQVAFIDTKRNLCLFDYLTETVEIVSNLGKVSEFVWDETGKIAAVNDAGVIIATLGEEPDTVFVRERSSDGVIGLNWSPGTGDQKLGFRVVRKGSSSAESFSALVIYSLADKIWCYASPMIQPIMGTEPSVSYPWMRVIFDSSGGMYAPVPISGSGGSVKLYYSY